MGSLQLAFVFALCHGLMSEIVSSWAHDMSLQMGASGNVYNIAHVQREMMGRRVEALMPSLCGRVRALLFLLSEALRYISHVNESPDFRTALLSC